MGEEKKRYIVGFDPYEEGKDKPKVAIVGAGMGNKTLPLAIQAILSGDVETVVDMGIEYPDPISDEMAAAILNQENPDQYTNIKRLPFSELVREFADYYDDSDIPNVKQNYRIVKDEEELKRFIDFLPDLQEGEKFYYSLFARKKYGATEGLKSDKCQLKRGTTTKERMLRDFKKLEVELGSYELDGLPINQDSLVLYITPNPRDMRKAALKTLKVIAEDVANEKMLMNPVAIAYNQVQVSANKYFFDIDLDFTDEGFRIGHNIIYNELLDDIDKGLIHINKEALSFVQTHGGFHILVEHSEIFDEYKNMWYRSISEFKSELFNITMNGDNMIPVAGCVQADTMPRLW